jgi:predicted alpha/beta hydrolase
MRRKGVAHPDEFTNYFSKKNSMHARMQHLYHRLQHHFSLAGHWLLSNSVQKDDKKQTHAMKKITINARDGYPLSALFGSPHKNPMGAIIISAATGVRKEFYFNFAKFLIENGYSVLIYDYRGIGESAPSDIKTSPAYMHEWGTKDMNAVLDHLVVDEGLTDIIWLGHSVGAQLVGLLKNKDHVQKVISINAAVGYWGYLPYPMKMVVWVLWYIIGPMLTKMYGYGVMKKIGWGENLPRNVLMEWRSWCLNKNYYMDFLKSEIQTDRFYNFTIPITAVYTSDDYIANDTTAPLMMQFFPNAPCKLIKLDVTKYTAQKVGHTGIFRKRFESVLWPLLLRIIQGHPHASSKVTPLLHHS